MLFTHSPIDAFSLCLSFCGFLDSSSFRSCADHLSFVDGVCGSCPSERTKSTTRSTFRNTDEKLLMAHIGSSLLSTPSTHLLGAPHSTHTHTCHACTINILFLLVISTREWGRTEEKKNKSPQSWTTCELCTENLFHFSFVRHLLFMCAFRTDGVNVGSRVCECDAWTWSGNNSNGTCEAINVSTKNFTSELERVRCALFFPFETFSIFEPQKQWKAICEFLLQFRWLEPASVSQWV